jgi:hypothetical protein
MGRKPIGASAMSSNERVKKHRERIEAEKLTQWGPSQSRDAARFQHWLGQASAATIDGFLGREPLHTDATVLSDREADLKAANAWQAQEIRDLKLKLLETGIDATLNQEPLQADETEVTELRVATTEELLQDVEEFYEWLKFSEWVELMPLDDAEYFVFLFGDFVRDVRAYHTGVPWVSGSVNERRVMNLKDSIELYRAREARQLRPLGKQSLDDLRADLAKAEAELRAERDKAAIREREEKRKEARAATRKANKQPKRELGSDNG